jgi:hypothetical protein
MRRFWQGIRSVSPRLGWEDNVKVPEGVKWIKVAEVRDRPVVSPCEHSSEFLPPIK